MTSMTSAPENPLPLGRPRYRRTLAGRIIGWLRANLFASIPSSIMSLLLIFVLGKALISLVQWGFVNAIWIVPGDQTGPCRAIRGHRRLLGGDPRKISLHPVRHLSVRRAMAAGAGDADVHRAVLSVDPPQPVGQEARRWSGPARWC